VVSCFLALCNMLLAQFAHLVLQIKHVLVERDILTATKTPWLVSLLYAFQDPEHIYLAMVSLYIVLVAFRSPLTRLLVSQEYVPGGDFRTLLNNSGVLKEEHARFYISEMFMCIDALHKLGYIREWSAEMERARGIMALTSVFAMNKIATSSPRTSSSTERATSSSRTLDLQQAH
jgi:hypothetical protein